MPMINIEDVYILGETGAEVDKVTGLFTKDEGTTSGEKAFAQLNIGTAGSNRNLLDNWYFVGGGSQLGDGIFPINQRGQTSYTGGRSIDRWRCWQTSTVTLTAAGLTFATGANADGLFQYFPKGKFESLYGETVTTSLLLTDGTLYTATGTASADCWIAKSFSGGYFGYICNGTEANFRISLDANQSKSIKAVKLERGAYSTLANDAPPDFWEELEKCQHYLWVASFPGGSMLSTGYASGDFFITDIILPTTIRESDLTLTFTSNANIIGNGTAVVAASVIGVTRYGNHLRTYINPASALTNQNLYAFVTSADTIMVVSAEL